MSDLKVVLIQTDLYWEDIQANLHLFDHKIDQINEQVDLIILPEMFSTGFTMNIKNFSKANITSLDWMKGKAKHTKAVITGSLIWEEDKNIYNRLFWVTPNGEYQTYDKKHLFSMGKEDLHYKAGTEKLVLKLNDWTICPQICYDLRFPMWNRNLEDYDLLFFVANWPEKRSDAWKTLLKARAIENQSYVIGVNRIGKDGNEIEYSGDSLGYGPMGEPMFNLANEDVVKIATLNKQNLKEIREKLPFLKDRDQFSI